MSNDLIVTIIAPSLVMDNALEIPGAFAGVIAAPAISIGSIYTSGTAAFVIDGVVVSIGSVYSSGAFAGVVSSPSVDVESLRTSGVFVGVVSDPSIVVETTGTHGIFNNSIYAPALNLSGSIGTVDSLNITIAAPGIVITGFTATHGTFAGVVKAPTISFAQLSDLIGGIVINTDNFLLSEYSNYNFDSFAMLGDLQLAIKDGNIYLLGGGTDAGEAIESSFITGDDDLGHTIPKRMKALLVGISSDGDMQYQQNRDTGLGEIFTIHTDGTNFLGSRRVGAEKIKLSRTISIAMSNIDGADFTVDSIEVPYYFSPVRRRNV
jgi:hypothetical protein